MNVLPDHELGMAMYSHAMIVSPQPEATEAGAVVLRRGGNAVDAAIACALTQGAVDPLMCSVAGFGSIQIYMAATGTSVCIDAHARCPASVTPDMWQDRIRGETSDGFGFIIEDYVNELGYEAVAVPGILRAYVEAVSGYGTWDWPDVVAPAISEAERGFVVRPYVYAAWTDEKRAGRLMYSDKLRFSETGRKIFFDDGGGYKRPGDWICNPDLARSLRRIAQDPETFFQGDMAEEIVHDMKRHGGRVTLQDLADYRTQHLSPLEGSYRGRRVLTNNPPGGGLMVVEMLNVLNCFDVAGMGHNSPSYIQLLAEVMKKAALDKDLHIGDPRFVDVPPFLSDPSYGRGIAEAIAAEERYSVTRLPVRAEPKDTTQICCVDRWGNAVSMTHSLGVPSGAITDGLGFMYNGCMSVFDPRPGRTGSIAPGKSRFGSMAPTIVLRDDRPELVLGAPGGTHITPAIVQAIANMIDFGMTMSDAVAAPRVSATSDALDTSNRIPRFVTDVVEKAGYRVRRSHVGYAFAAVHGIAIGRDGEMVGGADPQRDGLALRVEVDAQEIAPRSLQDFLLN